MVRPRLQVVIPCFVIAATTAIYGFLRTGVDGNFPINLIALTPVFFFASIAYAITAHDAFEINRLLRRTALYFALTLVIAATYAVIVAVLSVFLPADQCGGVGRIPGARVRALRAAIPTFARPPPDAHRRHLLPKQRRLPARGVRGECRAHVRTRPSRDLRARRRYGDARASRSSVSPESVDRRSRDRVGVRRERRTSARKRLGAAIRDRPRSAGREWQASAPAVRCGNGRVGGRRCRRGRGPIGGPHRADRRRRPAPRGVRARPEALGRPDSGARTSSSSIRSRRKARSRSRTRSRTDRCRR